MKTIKISNGETRIGFEFKDLSLEAQDTVLNWWIDGEIQDMNDDSPFSDIAAEMEALKTPWFLGPEIYQRGKQHIIETIEMNGYLFDENGEVLPIITHVAGPHNDVVKQTWGNREYLCTIE